MSEPSLRILLSDEQIQQRIQELGEQIAQDYPEGRLYLVGALKGACIFLADLVRSIPRPVCFDFVGASSYGGRTASSGEVKLTKDLQDNIDAAHVLLVEDIVDTGLTLNFLLKHLAGKGPRSVRVVSLLDKPKRRRIPVKIDYLGFTVPDEFVVGYGMDCGEEYRDLKDICVLEG
jgi:hypoxanthine phosphoribosyltransferase